MLSKLVFPIHINKRNAGAVGSHWIVTPDFAPSRMMGRKPSQKALFCPFRYRP